MLHCGIVGAALERQDHGLQRDHPGGGGGEALRGRQDGPQPGGGVRAGSPVRRAGAGAPAEEGDPPRRWSSWTWRGSPGMPARGAGAGQRVSVLRRRGGRADPRAPGLSPTGRWSTRRGAWTVHRDWKIVEMELIYRDLSVIENRLSRLNGKKKLLPEEEAERALLLRCQDCLMEERSLRDLSLTPEEGRDAPGLHVPLRQAPDPGAEPGRGAEGGSPTFQGERRSCGTRRPQGSGCCPSTVVWRWTWRTSPRRRRRSSPNGLDITEPGRERLIAGAYGLLGLISFFTCGPDEVRAWTPPVRRHGGGCGGDHPLGPGPGVHPRPGGGLRGLRRPGLRLSRLSGRGVSAPGGQGLPGGGRGRHRDPVQRVGAGS